MWNVCQCLSIKKINWVTHWWQQRAGWPFLHLSHPSLPPDWWQSARCSPEWRGHTCTHSFVQLNIIYTYSTYTNQILSIVSHIEGQTHIYVYTITKVCCISYFCGVGAMTQAAIKFRVDRALALVDVRTFRTPFYWCYISSLMRIYSKRLYIFLKACRELSLEIEYKRTARPALSKGCSFGLPVLPCKRAMLAFNTWLKYTGKIKSATRLGSRVASFALTRLD